MVSGFINTLVALLVAGATLSFNFSAADTKGVEQYSTDGNITTFENRYVMQTPSADVICNAATLWIVQKEINEIIIQNASDGASVMNNPFAILQNADKNYKVEASLPDKNNIPHKITLTAKSGAVYTITIKSYAKIPLPDVAQFDFDEKNYRDAVITDMR